PLPQGVAFDGEDLSQSFFGKSLVRKGPLFWEYGRNEAFNYPKIERDRSPNVAMRDGKWKLLVNAAGSNVELYDLDADCNETKNLADANPEVAKRMTDAALKWRKSLP